MSDEPQRGKRKTPAQHKKLASLLAQEVPVGQALRQAGWSERQSMKGWDAVPDQVLIKLPKKAQKLIALGKTDRETRKHLVRGRLVENVVKGKDGGTMSAKVLGSDKELGMWTPDMQTGLVVIGELPAHLESRAKALLADDPNPGKD